MAPTHPVTSPESGRDSVGESGAGFDPYAMDSAAVMRLITDANGLEIRDRFHYLRRYPSCFTGNEFADLLVQRCGITRRQAVRIGERLLAQDHIRHVAGEHDFKDEALFYAIGSVADERPAGEIDLSVDALVSMVRTMRGAAGIPVQRKRRWLVDYPDCFSAREATDWIMRTTGMSHPEAVRVGQALLQSNFIRHVFDELHFVDGRDLYRFV